MSDFTKEQVVKIMREERLVMMASLSESGKIQTHPMTPQEITDDADAWFFIALNSDQARQIKANREVNLAFAETGSWLSVSGTIEFVEDRAQAEKLWNKGMEAYFEGVNDPNLGLIRFNSESAQFWGTPGGKVMALAEIVKNRLTGADHNGTSDTVEL